MRVRNLVLPIFVSMLLVGAAAPASAHISNFEAHTFTADCDATDCGDWDTVRGTITCTQGESYVIRVLIEDDPYYGKGRTRGTCTGTPQEWVVTLTYETGDGDGRCPYEIFARARTFDRKGSLHGTAQDTWGFCG